MAHVGCLTGTFADLRDVSIQDASLRGSQESRLSRTVSSRRRHSVPALKSLSLESRVVRPAAASGLCELDEASSFGLSSGDKPSSRLFRERQRFSASDAVREPVRPRGAEKPRGMPVSCRARPGAFEEALFDQEDTRSFWGDEPSGWSERSSDFGSDLDSAIAKPGGLVLPKFVNDRADNVALHNPLKRLERLGCGWLCVLLEWEGVMVEGDPALELKSWAMLAEEEGKPQPQGFLLRRADGMKNEQAIMEVFCWARDFRTVKRMAQRRDAIYEELQGGCYRLLPGSKEFVASLRKYNTPIAVVSTRPKQILERAIEAVGMEGFFDAVVTAEDVQRGKPDPEMFQYAATCLKFIPERCIVVGNSNSTTEAAHDALMKVVAVAGKHRAYELGAADLVVTRLDDLSIVDLKNLADLDSVEFQPPMEAEAEPEEERILPRTSVAEY